MRYHYTACGLDNVWLENGFKHHTTSYGAAVSFDRGDELDRAIGLVLAKKPASLTGQEFRFFRTQLLLSQSSIGDLLGVSNQAIALWEKGKRKVPKSADIALRVIYTAHVQGDEQVRNVVTALNEAERVILVLRETSRGWKVRQEAAVDA